MENSISADGGKLKLGIVELEDCKTSCLNNYTCVGFDWTKDDTATQRCWLFTDLTILQHTMDNTGVDHYTREDCEGISRRTRIIIKT